MKSDIEIARETALKPIASVAKTLGIDEQFLEYYGTYKAKLNLPELPRKRGKLVLVTAINPTPYGEGKTTVSIGLADGLRKIGKNACLALREPSLGPVFGVKGGATGGGRAQIAPMEEINLHFTGDFHALTTANNLLSALIDNHLKQGNELRIDPERSAFKRTLDMNDRALREVRVAEGGEINGTPRNDGFTITSASETMAILCLSENLADLKRRLGNIFVAHTYDGKEIFARDLGAADAMTILLKEALKPNLVQTLEGTPAIVHGGPFANIAHGCNSVAATKAALAFSEVTVTEAGFGAELGAEKFFDIKCRLAKLNPDAVVLVATARSLKYNGGAQGADVNRPNPHALEKGLCNLKGHVETLKNVFGMNVVVAVNRFTADTEEELKTIVAAANAAGAEAVVTESWAKGGDGAVALAEAVVKSFGTPCALRFSYDLRQTVAEKIEAVAKKVYGAGAVVYSDLAERKLKELELLPYRDYPVCIAKTQYSFSADPTLLGRPKGFSFPVRDIEIRAGAEFLVVIAGSVMLMPGLPKIPAAVKMTISDDGTVDGLF